MKQVADYEVELCGIDHSQYFPGRSTIFTDWDEVYVGIGDNPCEALDDALENAAQCDWEVEAIENNEEVTPSAFGSVQDEDGEYDEDATLDLYYYVALYLKEKEDE